MIFSQRIKRPNVKPMRRVVKQQGQFQNENLSNDFVPQLPRHSSHTHSRTGLWKCAADWGVKTALVVMARRYLLFGIVGANGMVVDMAALFVLADPRMLHLNLSLGKALAAEIAIFGNFIGNELWTFRDLASVDLSWRGRLARFGRFNLICLAGIGLSVLLLFVQTRWFYVNMYVGNLIVIILVSLWNFGMNQKFGWKKVS